MEYGEYPEEQTGQQQIQGGGGYYQPTIMPSEKADLFDKINPQDVVEVFKYKMMGYEFDRQKQDWFKPSWSKGISEQGANELANLMLSVSNKNVAISKLSDGEIRARTKSIHKEAMLMCVRNWKEYKLCVSDVGVISQIVVSNTFITLKQHEMAGIRELLKGTTQESRVINEQPKKESILGGIFRR